MRARIILSIVVIGVALTTVAQDSARLPQTSALTNAGDLSAQMVAGIDRWLMRETERIEKKRAERNESPTDAARERLRRIIGAVDREIIPFRMLYEFQPSGTTKISKAHGVSVTAVRWQVFEHTWAEGLLLKPTNAFPQVVVAIPDAGQTPEMIAGLVPGIPDESQFARHLAELGFVVLVPALINRTNTYPHTELSHREWIYRQSYEVGRHLIAYEVQTVLSGIEAASRTISSRGVLMAGVGVAGYGEGGLIALYAAAIDRNIQSALVSGYFGDRSRLWSEPIDRNLFGLLRGYGDAEIAALISPYKLVVEYSKVPPLTLLPATNRKTAAPGALSSPDFAAVEAEVDRANELAKEKFATVVNGAEGMPVQFGSPKALTLFAQALGHKGSVNLTRNDLSEDVDAITDADERQERLVREWEIFTRKIFVDAEKERTRRIWDHLRNTNTFLAMSKTNREFFWREVIGKLDAAKLPPNPRTRKIYDEAKWTGYDVMLDVVPDVFAWGVLLVPKDLKPGERRPVVVCQHGLEGVPADTIATDTNAPGWKFYKGFAAKLAERGFIVYAPHNPYRGRDSFRVLQRKANPLGLSLFSFIIAQHEVTTDWLASLPFVDPQRIAFYGLSYGGKTAMRVPAVLDRYCLSICSGDFNEWIQKCITTESPYSYLFTGEYEMPEWDLGHTFNYAEMAGLIAPRPFMVERGHDDMVAPDTWVAYEYAKVRRLYDALGIGDRTEIEFFNGPHTINGVGTFKFLHRHLNWPEPK